MKKFTSLIAALFIFTSSVSAFDADKTYTVMRVLDGDSIVLNNGTNVRLLGIDAPEMNDTKGRNRRNAMRFGANPDSVTAAAVRSKELLKEWVLGKAVRLELDAANSKDGHRDKYGRLLAFVYLEGETELSVNGGMIYEGYAFAYRKFRHSKRGEFMRYERRAKVRRKGIWL